MISPTSKKVMLNAACSGIAAGILMKFVIGDVQTVSYFNMALSAPVAVGMAVGVASVISDTTSEMIIKRFAITNQMMNGASMIVNVGVSGAATAAVLYLGGASAQNIIPSFMIGSGSKLLGDYTNTKLFDPREGMIGNIGF